MWQCGEVNEIRPRQLVAFRSLASANRLCKLYQERDSAQPKLLEAILHKDNFNRAYKRGKANKGAPGIDGMTVEEALAYLKEHQQELTNRIYRRKCRSAVFSCPAYGLYQCKGKREKCQCIRVCRSGWESNVSTSKKACQGPITAGF